MEFVLFIIVGILAGYLADYVIKDVEFGLVGKLVVGVLGALVGGWILDIFGLSPERFGIGGLLAQLIVAFLGAVLLLWLWSIANRDRDRV